MQGDLIKSLHGLEEAKKKMFVNEPAAADCIAGTNSAGNYATIVIVGMRDEELVVVVG